MLTGFSSRSWERCSSYQTSITRASLTTPIRDTQVSLLQTFCLSEGLFDLRICIDPLTKTHLSRC
ncbi:hypothetical protein KSP39_PZI020275 [Platanthera zijinensis]|uniref:Uncharacterized protein n=1 Tax=Platanthera zijinensis TaxID=2320716 RepID=A0AAP0FX34_9ASPA